MSKKLWQNLFRTEHTVPVTAEHISDGELQTFELRAIILEAWSLQTDQFPHEAVNCTFLLPPGEIQLRPGDRITYRGQCRDIAQVEICKTLSGTVVAQRCITVS